MLIVGYDDKYKQDIVAIVRNFYNEALKEYSGSINLDVLLKTIEQYRDNAFLLIINDKCEGLLAGMTVQSLISIDKVYQELIWFVNERFRKCGVFLLRKAEKMLKAQGYTQIVMACMANSKTDKLFTLYERMNFKPFETHFIKTL